MTTSLFLLVPDPEFTEVAVPEFTEDKEGGLLEE